jgi:uroporphyrinogen-III synthase
MSTAAENQYWVDVGESPEGDLIESLHDIDRQMSLDVPLQEILGRIVDLVSKAVKCDSCNIYEVQADGLFLWASSDRLVGAADSRRISPATDMNAWLAAYRRPIVIPIRADRDFRCRLFGDAAGTHFEAFLSVPLLSRGRLLGVLKVQNRTKRYYSESEVNALKLVGSLLGTEIERRRLETVNASLKELLRDDDGTLTGAVPAEGPPC